MHHPYYGPLPRQGATPQVVDVVMNHYFILFFAVIFDSMEIFQHSLFHFVMHEIIHSMTYNMMIEIIFFLTSSGVSPVPHACMWIGQVTKGPGSKGNTAEFKCIPHATPSSTFRGVIVTGYAEAAN